MERTGTMPISWAKKTARRGSARLKTKPPVGPLNSSGSTMRRSTSMTSGRGHRIAATSARHCFSLCANYRPSPCPLSESNLRHRLSREGVLDPAVHRDGAARGLGRAVRCQEADGLGHVLGQDGRRQDIALAVEVLELLDGDALGPRALAPHVLRPELGVAKDGVGADDVRADAVRAALERHDLGELGLGRLG